jgi:hypothetical protein
MNATNFFTRRILGMDYRVWGVMLLVCLLSVGLYGYKQIKFSIINDRPCPPDTIAINGKRVEDLAICYLNRYYQFAIQSVATSKVEWKFKDDTNVEQGQIVYHKFIQEGIYRITATINGRCEFVAEVEVVNYPLNNQKKPAVEIHTDPKHPTIGSVVKFHCVSDVLFISSYEWKVLETNEVQKDAVPAFTFREEGIYTIQLVINDDPSILTTSRIKVTTEMTQGQGTSDDSGSSAGIQGDIGPLPNLVSPGVNYPNANNNLQSNTDSPNNNQGAIKPNTPKKDSLRKAPEVDPVAFKDLLQNVVDENGKELEDLYEYLDYKASTMVEVNENTTLIPLKDFCKNMRDKKKKKRKIESLSLKIDDKKSIQVIRVKVPESGSWWNPFD